MPYDSIIIQKPNSCLVGDCDRGCGCNKCNSPLFTARISELSGLRCRRGADDFRLVGLGGRRFPFDSLYCRVRRPLWLQTMGKKSLSMDQRGVTRDLARLWCFDNVRTFLSSLLFRRDAHRRDSLRDVPTANQLCLRSGLEVSLTTQTLEADGRFVKVLHSESPLGCVDVSARQFF